MTRRRSFTITEVAIAMAVAIILGAVGNATYWFYIHRAADIRAAQFLDELHTDLATFEVRSAGATFPVDGTNQVGHANTGAASYDALLADLGDAQLFPPFTDVFASWAYQPGPASPWASVTDGIAVSLSIGPSGTVSGTVGGVQVSGTLSGTNLSLTAGGATFVTATYGCAQSCQLVGTIAGVSVDALLGGPLGSGTTAMAVTEFGNHGAWASSVARWANANVGPGGRGQIISDAARSKPVTPPSDPFPATSYTIWVTAAHGTGAVVCTDSTRETLLLPPGSEPSNPGVSCRTDSGAAAGETA